MCIEKICEKCCTPNVISFFKILGNGLNIIILQIIGFFVVALSFFTYYYEFPLYSMLHVILTTVGLSLLISEAIMLIPNKQFCGPLSPNQNALIHGSLVTAGVILTFGGIVIITKYKYDNKIKHLASIHSIAGLVSIILLLLALFLGSAIIFIKHCLKRGNVPRNSLYWWDLPHHICGSLGYGIGMGALCYGLSTSYFCSLVPYEIRLVLILTSIVIGSWTMFCAFITLCNMLKKLLSKYDHSEALRARLNQVPGETNTRQ